MYMQTVSTGTLSLHRKVEQTIEKCDMQEENVVEVALLEISW